MAPKKPLLEQMRLNPRADWDINAIRKLCGEHGIELQPPSNGSHYKAVSPYLAGHLTIPYKRPIKPVYIRELVEMVSAHEAAKQQIEKE
ncbi:type II toxin-antitoxin system HicA family toxin [Pelagibacterium sp. H642]|uniref:type II toxin-antitoxin system HicA family toxin n=1 Tax=Pelagibacterium sp. H642 TaxID=1881069 RepID=UPI002814E9F2|nr:type II toxin-antitoxin system HicA family toxin [Pelagibacterium sp. H642]WMT91178.1 type II toxin-antitoxin system HicA family toxin [Pelagibacterium sp. H642]